MKITQHSSFVDANSDCIDLCLSCSHILFSTTPPTYPIKREKKNTITGHYPLHFHVCGFVGEKEALLKNNVIRNSYARAVVVHGTYGTNETSPGVLVSNTALFNHQLL